MEQLAQQSSASRRQQASGVAHSSASASERDDRRRRHAPHELRSIAPKSQSSDTHSGSARIDPEATTSEGTPSLSPTSDNLSLSPPLRHHASPRTPPDASFHSLSSFDQPEASISQAEKHDIQSVEPEEELEMSTQESSVRKQRSGRGRVRLELAPDQPPTTQGKERERVYVACVQCRSRKIRCNGEKPSCHNCRQRAMNAAGSTKAMGSNASVEVICVYDAVPKRRGPDKQPGARHRAQSQSQSSKRNLDSVDEGSGDVVGEPGGVKRRQKKRASTANIGVAKTIEDRPVSSIIEPESQPLASGSHHHEHASYLPTSSVRSDNEELHNEGLSSGLHLQFPTQISSKSGSTRITETHLVESIDLRHQGAPNLAPRSIAPMPAPELRQSGTSIPFSLNQYSSPTSDRFDHLTLPFPKDLAEHSITHNTLPTSLPLELHAIVPSHQTRLSPAGLVSPSTSSASTKSTDIGLPTHSFISSSLVNIGYTGASTGLAPAATTSREYDLLPQSSHPNTHSTVQSTSDPRNPYSFFAPDPEHHVSQVVVARTEAFIADEDQPSKELRRTSIAHTPSLEFSRKTWWDALVEFYASPISSNFFEQREPYSKATIEALTLPLTSTVALTSTDRSNASRLITSDLQFLFRASNFWFAFVHVPLFFSTFCNPAMRTQMQPSLILAVLAMSTLLRSSELGKGHVGRMRALWLRERAQAALEASICAGWIEPQLVQAAWLLAMFEFCTHPMQNSQRTYSALSTLDSLIRSLSLTTLDAENPTTSTFGPGAVPRVSQQASWPTPLYTSSSSNSHAHSLVRHHPQDNSPPSSTSCSCESLSLGRNWSLCLEHAPLWLYTPAWSSEWSETQIRQEECRRLCWNSLTLITGYTSYATAVGDGSSDLYVMRPENYHLLFPGENLSPSQPSLPTSSSISIPPSNYQSKETVWALYARAMLLWNSCVRMRGERIGVNDHDRASFANAVWLEAEAIEEALNRHKCAAERAFLFQGREYLFNSRMYISYEFRRFVPYPGLNGLFQRKKAEEWLRHQSAVAQRVMQGLASVTGQKDNILAQRPFYVHWFMSQVARCLQLWSYDQTLTIAIELSKSFLPPIDYLTAIWPSAHQRMQYKELRQRLDHACLSAGLALPPPPNIALPASLL